MISFLTLPFHFPLICFFVYLNRFLGMCMCLTGYPHNMANVVIIIIMLEFYTSRLFYVNVTFN